MTMIQLPCIRLALILIAYNSVFAPCRAESPRLLYALHCPVNVPANQFGYSMAGFGKELLIGGSEDDTGAKDAGSVYVFDPATGNVRLTIHNPAPARNDHFGDTVGVVAGNLVVGCPPHNSGAEFAGAGFIYDGKTGAPLKTLQLPKPLQYAHLGCAVAISEKKIVLGAYGEGTGLAGAGSAFVFDGDPSSPKFGEVVLTLHNPAPGPGANFAYSVAATESTIVVGAPRNNTGARKAGDAYQFDAATGKLLNSLHNPVPKAGDQFGYSVAANKKWILVGAPLEDSGATDAGSVYLFDARDGKILSTIHHPEPAENDHFGNAVAFVGNDLVIGAELNDTGAQDVGAVYVFGPDGKLLSKIANPEPKGSSAFGHFVGSFGDRILVGAPSSNQGPRNPGTAYVFESPKPKSKEAK